jgi:hypothetical protein
VVLDNFATPLLSPVIHWTTIELVDRITFEMTRFVPLATSIALIVSIVSVVISFKAYHKSKRLEFLQRRDQLFLKISELNAENSKVRLIAARYGIVLLNKASQPVLDEKQAEENKTLVVSIKQLVENIELIANRTEVLVKQLHATCSNFTLETDATIIEKLIAIVQGASDEAKRNNEGYLASLYTQETTDPMLRASVAKIHELDIRKAELELEEAMRNIKRKKP